MKFAWLVATSVAALIGFLVVAILLASITFTLVGFIGPALFAFLIVVLLVISIYLSMRSFSPRKRHNNWS